MLEKIKRVIKYILYGIPTEHILKCNVVVSQSTKKLLGKNILITGGGRGLGFYIAQKCILEGANVVIVGRNEDVLKTASKELKCRYIAFDLSNISNISKMLNEAINMLDGRIDCLVNNAGISLHEKSMMEVTLETFDKQLDINLKAPYFLTQKFIKHCIDVPNKKASVVFVSSERGLYCDEIPYGLIKAAINSLTRGIARRHVRNGIRVNAIAPGITESDMTIADRTKNMACEYNCGGRFFLPEEVAETAAFILSDEANCINGEIIACDQGNYLRCDW